MNLLPREFTGGLASLLFVLSMGLVGFGLELKIITFCFVGMGIFSAVLLAYLNGHISCKRGHQHVTFQSVDERRNNG